MKIDKLILEQLITEELVEVLTEQGFLNKVKSGAKKLAAAGIMAGALASGGAKAAPEKVNHKPSTTVVDKKQESGISDIDQAALGFLEKWQTSKMKKGQHLSFDQLEELIIAQKALAKGYSVKNNSYYDIAKKQMKELKSKDPELFNIYFKAGNPKFFTFN